MPVIEKELSPFQPRPHWGKLFTFSGAQLHSSYDKLPEFMGLCKKFDPKGKFRNEFLDSYIFGSA
jgi:xylitol oxidase